ncbi:oxidoreductase [Virgisporangium aliadipatigenens]|uniref:Oxidoreductase n=1 Tax=Virgisporangium aliadipatigenens TaxID=741659 RepID=A0A8J3YSR2_9ACTN|nr:ferredoxin reductase [Virgisporangium aliadipatigenens]GIJ49073.1 oxidoreductase [Virgisporangium aliadipatigenens]
MSRFAWRVGTLVASRPETATARTLVLDVPGWPGHLAGQRVDVRLTAADGYTARRSYSIASAPDGTTVELTVQRVADGEVSPYLTGTFAPGYPIGIRGPVGGWFVYSPERPEPVLLVAGGSGIVPLMAMLRAREAAGVRVPFRLVYSVRTPADVIYASELRRDRPGVDVALHFTREAPPEARRPPGRITPSRLAEVGWPPDFAPTVYVCGPNGFVEHVTTILVAQGHDPSRIRTERFGPSGP